MAFIGTLEDCRYTILEKYNKQHFVHILRF